MEKRQFDFEHEAEITEKIKSIIAEKTLAEWLELVGSAEFCVSPVCTLDEALQSQLTEQENMLSEQDTDLGKLRYIGSPVKFSGTESKITRRAPRLGEHTEEILAELGHSSADIASLKEEGAI